MKRLFALITAMALIAFSAPTAFAAEGAVVEISSASGRTGESVTLALSMRGTGRLCGASVEICYDPDGLLYTYHIVNTTLKADYLSVKELEKGRIRLSFTDVEDDIAPLGPLVYLCFHIVSETVGETAVTVEERAGALFDHSYIELEYTPIDGRVWVLPALTATGYTVKHGIIYLPCPTAFDELKAALPTEAKIAPGQTVLETGRAVEYGGGVFYTALMGDVNCDGQVSTADFLHLGTFLKGLCSLGHPALAAADADGNGMHGTADAVRLKALLAGKL